MTCQRLLGTQGTPHRVTRTDLREFLSKNGVNSPVFDVPMDVNSRQPSQVPSGTSVNIFVNISSNFNPNYLPISMPANAGLYRHLRGLIDPPQPVEGLSQGNPLEGAKMDLTEPTNPKVPDPTQIQCEGSVRVGDEDVNRGTEKCASPLEKNGEKRTNPPEGQSVRLVCEKKS